VIRKAFRMSVEPDHQAEYIRRHNPIWRRKIHGSATRSTFWQAQPRPEATADNGQASDQASRLDTSERFFWIVLVANSQLCCEHLWFDLSLRRATATSALEKRR
jgi:hypothetical protein